MKSLYHITYSKIKIGLGMLIAVTLTSCEKEINVDLPEYQSKIVIEGSIETGEPAMVFITRSADYFQKYDMETLKNMFVTNAVVTVTNQNGVVDSLHYITDPTQAMPFLYKGSTVLGETGGTFKLKVVVDGKEYLASTTILPAVPLDSLNFIEQDGPDHAGIVRANFTDPAGEHNYYRVFAKVIGHDQIFIPVWGGATFDDRLIDGIHTSGDIYRGSQSNLMQNDTSTGENRMSAHYFMPGDIVVIKWCSMDYNSFKFWNSADVEINSGGNPFMSPAPIISNIPDALGVWCGYGTLFDTLVVPSGSAKRISGK
jgi:hypothetical protein